MTLFNERTVLSLGLTMALGTLATGQAPVADNTPLPGDLLSIAEHAVGVSVDGDTVCGLGPDYKASFTSAGLEFVPALGQAAPRNYPLRFRLESIRRGNEVLFEASSTTPAEPRVDGTSVLYDRGPGLVERYDVRADGVEQSFVFQTRPSGAGEIVVRGRIDTELQTTVLGAAEGGLSFRSEGFGGVRMGSVVGIDALGYRDDGSLRFDGTHVELTLPADLVDRAAYPLVLDPLISAEFTVGTSTGRDIDPDVAFLESTGSYLVVWEQSMSAVDVDIVGIFLTTAGVASGGLIGIETSAQLSTDPTAAAVAAGTGGYFVAWHETVSPFVNGGIVGRTVTPSGSLSPKATIASPGAATDATNPDVGGMVTQNDDRVLVVWQQQGADPGIRTRYVDLQGTFQVLLGTPRALTPVPEDCNPAISKTAGAADRHLIVWERFQGSFIQIRAASSDYNGGILDLMSLTGHPAFATHPAVDGDGTDFMVVYQKEEAASPSDHGIYCQKLRLDSAGTIARTVAERVVEDEPNDDQMQPSVAFLGLKYLVAWADEESTFSYHIYLRPLNAAGQPCGPRRQVSFGSQANHEPEIAARYSGQPTSAFTGSSAFDQALIVYESGDITPLFDTRIRGRLFEAIGTGGSVTVLGPACGNGGTIAANGPVAVGNMDFAFTLSGADTSSLIYGIGLGFPAAPLVCGSCSFVNGSYNFVGPMGTPGTASFTVPIPCNGSLTGLPIDAQWIAFGTSASPCPLAATLSASNRIRVTVGL